VSVTGRVEAVDRVDLVARVDGFLEEVAFTEGETVEEGALLYRLERDMFEAEVRQAEGILEQARASKVLADLELDRAQQLLDREVGTEQARDIAKAGADKTAGAVAEAEASLAKAQVNLGYTEIRAPVGGRIGMSALTRGAVVGPASGVLATVVSQDPMHVTFPVSAREFLREKKVDRAAIRVRIALADGEFYPEEGRLDFVDVTVDQGTDTVLARSTIANPDGRLIAGQLVTVTLEAGTPDEVPVVAQSALVADQGGLYVFVVEDGKAAVRRVRTAGASGADAVVAEGLAAGDLVIVEGLERVRPGVAVVAAPAEPGPAQAPKAN
jgi:membrane fusion protein (multidrug efflux system)